MPVTTGFGVADFYIELWKADRYGNLIEDLTRYMVDGEVSMNLDSEVVRTGSVTFRQKGLIEPLVDCIKPYIKLKIRNYPDVRKAVGLYMTHYPEGERSRTLAVAKYPLTDFTEILHQWNFTSPYNVASGVRYTTAVSNLVTASNIPLVDIPAETSATKKKVTVKRGDNRLETINKWLEAAKMYPAYTDHHGYVRSQKKVKITQKEPLLTLDGSLLTGPIKEQPMNRDPYNVVVLQKDRGNESYLVSKRRNDDPDSPTSTVALQRESVYFASVSDVDDQSELDDMAEQILADERTFYQTIQLDTFPQPEFGVHDVIQFDGGGQLGRYSGLWWVRSWTMGLLAENSTVRLTLNRIKDENGKII